jgi:hypothetical protein
MNAAVNRRVFVGSVAAGLPVLAGAAYGLAATPPAPAHGHATAKAQSDAVFDHVVQEIAAIQNRGVQRGFTGEDARAIAAQLRTASARSAQLDLDTAARKGVQQLIGSRGREAVLAIETDRAQMKAQLKRYGMEVEDRWFAAGVLEEETRRRALDALTSGGVTGVLSHGAGVFEKLGSACDRLARSTAGVRRIQFEDPLISSICWQIAGEIAMLWGQAGPICEASAIVQELESLCAAIWATLAAYYAMYFTLCR